MSSPTGNVTPIGGALTMAKTPKALEQIHEHNRKVLRELQFDPTKWLPVPRAIRALVRVCGPALQAAAELLKLMRSPSGAIPTATRCCRWHDGLQTSHLITRYPPPADWDAVSPESLIMDFREISKGDGNVVRCWDYVDLQYFNRWLSALAEQPSTRFERPKVIDWTLLWSDQRFLFKEGKLPSRKTYLVYLKARIKDLFDVTVAPSLESELRRFRADLYSGKTERTKRTSGKRASKKRISKKK